MSRVYFHSPHRTAELRGSERAWLGGLITDIAIGALGLGSTARIDRLRELIHPDHYMAKQDTTGPGWLSAWASSYATAFSVGWSGSAPLIQHRGRAVETFELALNTALTLGGDAVKLGARLHGSCEIHAWVDGPNRSWLADIMQGGIDAGVYRDGFARQIGGGGTVWSDQGWGDVIALLRERDDEPVVTSYSVCDGFPDPGVGDWMPPWPKGVPRDWRELTEEQRNARSERSEEWYDLDDAEQWRISMAGLRASKKGLQLEPAGWSAFRFGHRLSVLDLVAADFEDRLDTALGSEKPST
ncbi:hypothetical protein [Streptomyces jumonjinensis]|uniref:hypothetical protein n=1 Tax=Streptomyces jumonjinensis TaxID=1945 RepID=UPI0037B86FCD